MSSTKGDPPPPDDNTENDPPIIVSGGNAAKSSSSADSEVQTSKSADIKPPTVAESESETVDADANPPIIVQGG